MDQVPCWMAHELTCESKRSWLDLFQDVDLAVELTTPAGRSFAVDAFWDRGRSWRAQMSPDEIGKWKWRLLASDRNDPRLLGETGPFACVPYGGPNLMYQHGA